ncbi:MAG: hypothetical protein M1822_006556 [Bathelium mastoideum]|nr:MAG: hypothetical protein M1822_006556 [Bathelium mastoideum]
MASTKPLVIDLTGSSTITRLAERGILSVSISSTGTSKSKVSVDVTKVSKDLQALFERLGANDPNTASPTENPAVASWRMQGVTTRTWIPTRWDPQTQQHMPAEREYSANASFTVDFKDFVVLSDVATDLTLEELVTVNSVTWSLTDETRDGLASENRTKAALDALGKARDYAAAVVGSHATIRAVALEEIANVAQASVNPFGGAMGQATGGLFGSQGQGFGSATAAAGGGGGEQAGLNLRAQDVDLRAGVRVKFIVEG